ncbi:hypothetical protein ACF1CG_01100 [Streptomyces sp. NPDC014773]|uniref:hypothetical protein n=1 Tax=Streptomyces sp. NPDC014773 TaxID=3364908 RepID=UPI0036FF820F
MSTEQAEADLISAAYFEFGKAMFAAATMERSLVNAVANHRLAAAKKEGRTLTSDPWEQASKAGIDKNIQKITPRLADYPGLLDRLNAAKKRRNHLAHDFCFDKAPDLFAAGPANRVITELGADAATFMELSNEVTVISRAIMQEMGIDIATADERHAALIQEARRAK